MPIKGNESQFAKKSDTVPVDEFTRLFNQLDKRLTQQGDSVCQLSEQFQDWRDSQTLEDKINASNDRIDKAMQEQRQWVDSIIDRIIPLVSEALVDDQVKAAQSIASLTTDLVASGVPADQATDSAIRIWEATSKRDWSSEVKQRVAGFCKSTEHAHKIAMMIISKLQK